MQSDGIFLLSFTPLILEDACKPSASCTLTKQLTNISISYKHVYSQRREKLKVGLPQNGYRLSKDISKGNHLT